MPAMSSAAAHFLDTSTQCGADRSDLTFSGMETSSSDMGLIIGIMGDGAGKAAVSVSRAHTPIMVEELRPFVIGGTQIAARSNRVPDSLKLYQVAH